mgnify:CR=1 FL=1
MERLLHDFRHVLGVLHQKVVLHDGARDADCVALLESIQSDRVRRHLTGDNHHGNAIHVSSGNAGHGIRQAGAGGDQRHADIAAYAPAADIARRIWAFWVLRKRRNEKEANPSVANQRMKALRALFSWANEEENTPSTWGDFPAHMRRFLRNRPIAVNFRGVAGAQTDEITTQIASSFTETDVSARVSPYTLCIMEGGTNDVAQAKTLAVMQSRRLAQIAAATARGMKIILLTVPPYNAANAGMQTVMDGYNAWIKTLGYPVYDVFTDANDGNSDLKTSWGSGDGVHPGQTYNDGSSIMGQRLADLVLLIGD